MPRSANTENEKNFEKKIVAKFEKKIEKNLDGHREREKKTLLQVYIIVLISRQKILVENPLFFFQFFSQFSSQFFCLIFFPIFLLIFFPIFLPNFLPHFPPNFLPNFFANCLPDFFLLIFFPVFFVLKCSKLHTRFDQHFLTVIHQRSKKSYSKPSGAFVRGARVDFETEAS